MTPDEARGYIKLLQDNYGGKFGVEVLKRAQNELLSVSAPAMDEAVNAILMTMTRLPSISTVMELANREEKKLRGAAAIEREQESARDKEAYKPFTKFEGITEFGRMCSGLMRKFFSGEIDKEVYLLTAIKIAEEYNKPDMLSGLNEDLQNHYKMFPPKV